MSILKIQPQSDIFVMWISIHTINMAEGTKHFPLQHTFPSQLNMELFLTCKKCLLMSHAVDSHMWHTKPVYGETGHFASLPFRPLHTELLNTMPIHHISYG